MLLDPYAQCPGGTGKKLKFCCSDMLKELDEVVVLMNGGQPLAALDRIRHVEEKFPDRACLLNYRILLEQALGEIDKATATAQYFAEVHPDNPVALAHHAVFKALQSGDAVESLQLFYRSIGANESTWQVAQAESGNLIGTRLVDTGYVVAGLSVLRMVYAVLEGNQAMERLLEACAGAIQTTERNPETPLLLKDEFRLTDPPEGALWKKSFEECRELLERGLIPRAAQSLEQLAETAGQWPELMRSLATLRLWLADNAGAAQALRTISRKPSPPTEGPAFEQAVDAEALLQLIDESLQDTVSRISNTFPIRDFDLASAEILSSPQLERFPGDLSQIGGPDRPAPKYVCRVFDRPFAEKPAADSTALADLPAILGSLMLYGKETDRAARIELSTYNTDVRDKAEHYLRTLLGDNLGKPEEPQVLESSRLLEYLLRSYHLVSNELSDTDRILFEQNQCRHALEDQWCHAPLKALNGKTPLQAADDPGLRIPLAAAVWLIELDGPTLSAELDTKALRQKLNLAPRPTIDGKDVDLRNLPVAKYLQLDVATCTDEQLIGAFSGAIQMRFVAVVKRLATEILGRPTDNNALKEFCYLQLAEVEKFDFKAIEYVRLARETAEAAGRSTISADLAELPLLYYGGQFEPFLQLLQKISTKHPNDQQVNSQLAYILMQLGVLRPDGSLAIPSMGGGGPGGRPSPAASTAEAAPSLWTPDSAATTGEKKSALWVPD
jgi:hypothetical protein